MRPIWRPHGCCSCRRSDVDRLKITEIFRSLQGEADTAGIPTVFVRLTGCPLRCQYCDTAYAFHGGEWATLEDVVQKVRDFDTHHVCVTGGEPLAQKGCVALLHPAVRCRACAFRSRPAARWPWATLIRAS